MMKLSKIKWKNNGKKFWKEKRENKIYDCRFENIVKSTDWNI